MWKQKKLIFGLMLISVVGVAQEDDGIPFDELEAELQDQPAPSTPQTPAEPNNVVRETLENPSKDENPDGLPEDESIEGMFEGDLQLADPEELESMPATPDELQTPPPAETPKIAKPETSEPIPEDKKVVQETPEDNDIPPALRDEELNLVLDSESDPSDVFSKIPLRDPLSETNWRKFAGSAIEKTYRVRKKDTLWAISERLFGNPYLWPKVWQLNANLGNPHEIDSSVEISFLPGQPNSAPALAWIVEKEEVGPLYLVENDVPLTLVERLEKILAYQNTFPHPVFKTFLLEQAPQVASTIPKQSFETERTFYIEGDRFKVSDLAPAKYSIVEVKSTRGDSFLKRSGRLGFVVNWVGTANVDESGMATVEKAFSEIESHHVLIGENFWMSPLQLRYETLASTSVQSNQIMTIQEGALGGAGAYQVLGVDFKNAESGANPGALLTIKNGIGKLGTGLVIYRQGRYATMAVIESQRELTPADAIE